MDKLNSIADEERICFLSKLFHGKSFPDETRRVGRDVKQLLIQVKHICSNIYFFAIVIGMFLGYLESRYCLRLDDSYAGYLTNHTD